MQGLPPLIDDHTLATLREVYGYGVGQVFDAFEGISENVFGGVRTQTVVVGCAAKSLFNDNTAVAHRGPSAATNAYRSACVAAQVRPISEMLDCCSAHDVLAWLEGPSTASNSFWSSADLLALCSSSSAVDAKGAVSGPAVPEGAEEHSPPPAAAPTTASAYMLLIERYLFAEERKAQEAVARAEEAKRREEAAAEAARLAAQVLSYADLNLLLLAEESQRRSVVEMFVYDFEERIMGPFVASLHKIASSLSFGRSIVGANSLMAILASLRCCPRAVTLSFSGIKALDTPFAVLLAFGPLRFRHLPLLETLVLDETPLGSLAVNAYLRVLRLPHALPNLSTLGILGVSCDPGVIRKIDAILQPRRERQACSKAQRRSLLVLEHQLEAGARRQISDAMHLSFHAIASQFYLATPTA